MISHNCDVIELYDVISDVTWVAAGWCSWLRAPWSSTSTGQLRLHICPDWIGSISCCGHSHGEWSLFKFKLAGPGSVLLVAGTTNRKYQVQVDPKPRAALYHVCRPRWKLLSPCPCHVLSLLLAVQWAPPAAAGAGWSGPSQLPSP